MTDVEHADLRCESCGEVADHELRYAGRLLESTRCSNCGHHILLDQRSLVPAYVRDLEQRLVGWLRERGPVELVVAPAIARRVDDASAVNLLESIDELGRRVRPES